MTREEVWAASLSDPDAQPLTARELKEFKPVGPPRRVDVAALRKRLKMSQAAFAARFGLDVSAVHAWEQGRRQPDRAARVLLTVIDREPAAVLRALARTK
jgi:putative transcriptional regulator